MFNNFGINIGNILKNAERERYSLKHPYVGSEHLLLSILKNDKELATLLQKYNLTYDSFKKELIAVVGSATKFSSLNLYTPLLKRILCTALENAKESEAGSVTTKNLVLSLLEEGEGIAFRILLSMEINLEELHKELISREENKEPALKKVGIILNDIVDKEENIIAREKEITQIIQILLRKKKNNPILVGKAGVGKTAIVEELTRKIIRKEVPLELESCQVILLEMGNLVAGTKYRGEFEEKLTNIINEIKGQKNIIIFIDEIHTLVNAGGAEGAINAADILKPYLARGDLKCIGATTSEEYEKFIKKDKALDRRFEKINVLEPSKEVTKKMLLAIKKEYENYHQVQISDQNVIEIVEMAEKYILDKNNPDKSIELLDTVCSYVKVNQKRVSKKDLKQELDNILQSKEKAIKENNFVLAYEYCNQELSLKNQTSSFNNPICLTQVDIIKVIEQKNGITFINDQKAINQLELRLKDNIFGQDKAIEKIIASLAKNINGSLAFLLAGPTGVGKTKMVKEIASYFEDRLFLSLDMNEYTLESSLNNLIGLGPIYGEYNEQYIFNKVRKNPFSIILIRNLENACDSVKNLILRIIEDGFVFDVRGEKISFENSLLFVTTKIPEFNESNLGFNQTFTNILEENLTKEMISNFNDVIEFNYLDDQIGLEFIKKQLGFVPENVTAILKKAEIKKYGLKKLKKEVNKLAKNDMLVI